MATRFASALHSVWRLNIDVTPFPDFRKRVRRKLDYIATGSKFADGLDCEVFNFKSLEKSYQKSKSNTDKEHVTTYIKRNKSKFKLKTYQNNKDNSKIRLTIDKKEDLKFLKKIRILRF